MKCKHNNDGWCYAPDDLEINDDRGLCRKPLDCPKYKKQLIPIQEDQPTTTSND